MHASGDAVAPSGPVPVSSGPSPSGGDRAQGGVGAAEKPGHRVELSDALIPQQFLFMHRCVCSACC